MSEEVLKNKRILIFQQRGWAISVGMRLAQKLEKEGCILAAITIKKSTHTAIINSKTNYEFILNSDEVKEDPVRYLGADSITLEDVCRDLGVKSVWKLAQASRYHVKSYKDKYYFGFKQNLSDQEIKNYILSIYKYISYIFDNFQPDFIITPNFAGLQHIMFNLFARKKGITMLGYVDSKVPNLTLLTTSYLADQGRFFELLSRLNSGVESQLYDDSKDLLVNIRLEYQKRASNDTIQENIQKKRFKQKIKNEFIPFARVMLFFLRRRKNQLKNQSVTLDDQSPYYIIRDYIQAKVNSFFSNKFVNNELPKKNGFAYYPLQVQPEATIDILSPQFNNQLETARQIAMSLPGEMTLVVKDHPSMKDKRPKSYLEKLSRLPNVQLVESNIATEKILKKSSIIISPGGTTLFQAAVLFKPVIQLGEIGTTKMLPNVFCHSDMSTLSEKIEVVLSEKIESEIYDKKLINYIVAAKEVGFDLDYYEIAEKNKKTHRSEVDAVCERLIEEIRYYAN
jgi:hypothetical protein